MSKIRTIAELFELFIKRRKFHMFPIVILLIALTGLTALIQKIQIVKHKGEPNHDFGRERGRHESYGCKTTGALHIISTRIQWD